MSPIRTKALLVLALAGTALAMQEPVVAPMSATALPAANPVPGRAPTVNSIAPSSGVPGTAVTLTGTGFGDTQGSSTVTFNGIAGRVASWTATTIVVQAPSGNIGGDLVVHVGGMDSNPTSFTVQASSAAGSHVASKYCSSTDSCTTDWTVTAGNLLVALFIDGPNDPGGTIFDGQGNSYVTLASSGSYDSIFRLSAALISTGGSKLSVSSSVRHARIVLAEFRGASLTVGGAVKAESNGGGQCPNTGVLSLNANAGDLVLSVISQDSTGGTTTLTSGNVVQAVDSGSAAFQLAYQVAAQAGSSTQRFQFSPGYNAGNQSCALVALRAKAAPQITGVNPAAAAVGSSVTITGSGFGATQGTNQVLFYGATATTTSSWSANSIVVTVPAGATTGSLIVRVNGVDSNSVNFTVAPVASSQPVITKVTPVSGAVGSTVTIEGANFGANRGSGTVRFNGTAATPTSWSSTSIAVPVPGGATSGNVVVQVGVVSSNGVSFTVNQTGPAVTSISPTSGVSGNSVTITGTNFGATKGSSTVKFNGVTAIASSWSAGSIVVAVPAGATTGNVVVQVAGASSNGVGFTVMQPAPAISSISPTSGVSGTSVTITGANFGATQGSSTVKFNGVTAIPSSWSAGSIVVAAPAGATTGNVVVQVAGASSNGVGFTITQPAPAISSISPTSGVSGTSVTITGTNFGATQGSSTVTFNGVTATATSWSAGSIVVAVPAGATTGNVVVQVAGAISNGVGFTVTQPAPVISSISPTSGVTGTAVTITGTNFGASQGNSTVTFNGTVATLTSWSATRITTAAPTGATSGGVVVQVGGLKSNSVTYSVAPPASPAQPSVQPLKYINSQYCSNTTTCTTGWNVSTGNLMVVMIYDNSGVPRQGVIDSQGNNYRPLASRMTYTVNFGIYGANLVSGGAPLILSTPETHSRIVLAEFSGATTVPDSTDQADSWGGAAASTCPINNNLSVTTTTAGLLISAVGEDSTGGNTVFTNGTLAQGVPDGPGAFQLVYQLASNPGTYTQQFAFQPNYNAGASSCVMVALRAQTKSQVTSLTPASGPVGSSVTIQGTGFWPTQENSQVLFNGVPAQVTSWSATSITAIVPAGATTGMVVVSVAGDPGSGQTFTVSAPAPVWSLNVSHNGFLIQGSAALYTTIVSNQVGAVASNGTVQVALTIPSGLSVTTLSGSGWNCSGTTCTRADSLAPGSSYPAILSAVVVATSAQSSVVLSATVSGGGSSIAVTATDSATVLPLSSSVTVLSTNTQAVLAYKAPDTNACTVKISELSDFSTLVRDVDPLIFPGSQFDNRATTLMQGTSRVFVAGSRVTMRSPADGNAYSRALQANTVHYYQVKCGASTFSGSFATANIPLGMTYSDPPELDPTSAGQPLIPASPTSRGGTLVDPRTGALISQVAAAESTANDSASLYDGGFVRPCSPNLMGPGPGYLCGLGGGSGGFLYYIIPTTGEIRFLGRVPGITAPLMNPVDNKIYAQMGDDVIRLTYIGDFNEVASGTTAQVVTETFLHGLTTMLQSFDPGFDPTLFGCSLTPGGQHPSAGKYGLIQCRRGYQDSYGWIGILAMGNGLPVGACGSDPAQCPHIIAAAKVYANPSTRWCGLHNIQVIPGDLVSITPHALVDAGGLLGGGPFLTTLTAPVAAGQTTISISGEPLDKGQVDPGATPVQAGDYFRFMDNNESVMVTKKNSATNWSISAPASAHPAGAALYADCNPRGTGGYTTTYWKFLSDPHGQDSTNTSYVVDQYWGAGGHDDWGDTLRLAEGYTAALGPIASNLNTPNLFQLDTSPQFAGSDAWAFGETTKKHPSYHQSRALPKDQQWFLDYTGFGGGNLFSPVPGTVQVSNQLYKYVFNVNFGPGLGNRKAQPTLAISGTNPLRDVSGPSSFIDDGANSSYTYCVAYQANECRPGSQPGDAFANVPGLTYAGCSFDGNRADLCIGPFPTFAQGVVQMGLIPNSAGEPAGNLVNGAGYSRLLTGGLAGIRQVGTYPTAKSLPDGSWAFFSGGDSLRMIKMPPFDQNDAVDRTGFVPLRVNLPPPSNPNAVSAVVEFGYAESGSPDQYFCTSRRETCVAVAPVLPQGDPFWYATTDQYAPAACKNGCTITIPVLPMHVVYYRVKYLDSKGAVATTGPMQVGVEANRAIQP